MDEDDSDFDEDDSDPVVECTACGEEMYDDAEQCPACGTWITRDSRELAGKPGWFLWVMVAIIVAVVASIFLA